MTDEVIGSTKEMLSGPEYQALQQMKGGMYLIKTKLAECISWGGVSIGTMVKAGTIADLSSRGLIYESINPNKWLLTDEGRKYE